MKFVWHNTHLVPIQQLVSKAFARNVCSCLSTQVKVRCSSYVFNKAFYMKSRCIESLMINYKNSGDKHIAPTGCKAKLTWNRIQETLIMLQFNRSCCEKGGDWKCTSMHAPSCHPAATTLGSLIGREVWRLVLVSPQTTRVLRVYNVYSTWVVWSENRAKIIAINRECKGFML